MILNLLKLLHFLNLSLRQNLAGLIEPVFEITPGINAEDGLDVHGGGRPFRVVDPSLESQCEIEF